MSGRLETVTKPNGVTLLHGYDALGRLVSLKSSDGTIDTFYGYNLLHQPVHVEDRVNGCILKREYDPMGRVLSEDFGSSIMLKNEYDLNGRRTRLVLPDQSQIDYTYQGMHLASVDRSNPNGELLYSHRYTQYDLSGNLLKQELIGNAGTMTYEVDQMGRTYAMHSPFGAQKVEKYDDFGNVRQVATDGQTSLYDYDAHHQISREKSFFSHDYGYDSHNNRLYKDENHYRVNDLNQIKSTQQSRFAYDDNGNLIRKDTSQQTTHYTYDALDRLISVETDDLSVCFTYDPLHRRLSKTVYDKRSKTQSQLRFLYDGQNEIGAYDSQGNLFNCASWDKAKALRLLQQLLSNSMAMSLLPFMIFLVTSPNSYPSMANVSNPIAIAPLESIKPSAKARKLTTLGDSLPSATTQKPSSFITVAAITIPS